MHGGLTDAAGGQHSLPTFSHCRLRSHSAPVRCTLPRRGSAASVLSPSITGSLSAQLSPARPSTVKDSRACRPQGDGEAVVRAASACDTPQQRAPADWKPAASAHPPLPPPTRARQSGSAHLQRAAGRRQAEPLVKVELQAELGECRHVAQGAGQHKEVFQMQGPHVRGRSQKVLHCMCVERRSSRCGGCTRLAAALLTLLLPCQWRCPGATGPQALSGGTDAALLGAHAGRRACRASATHRRHRHVASLPGVLHG